MTRALSLLTDPTLKKKERTKRIVEALLFGAAEPLSIEKIKDIISESHPVTSQEIKAALLSLQEEYEMGGHSFELFPIASGFALRTKAEFSSYIERLRGRREEKLSRAATEILAIIAHLQPVTRTTIDKFRGVDSSGTLSHLMERGMIEITGRLETPGRPAQYGITRRFLLHLGLNDITDLHQKEKT